MPNHLRPLHLEKHGHPTTVLTGLLCGPLSLVPALCRLLGRMQDPSGRPPWLRSCIRPPRPSQLRGSPGLTRLLPPPHSPLAGASPQPGPRFPSSGSDGRSSRSTTGMSYTESLALLILSRPTSYRTKADTDPSSFGCWTHGSKQRSLFTSLKILSILHFNQRLCSLLEYQIKFVYFKK